MGDPLYKDYYDDCGLDNPRPYVIYTDHKNNTILNDENEEDVLGAIGFKILDVAYAEPMENRFCFSGIRYEADNIFVFTGIMLVYFLLCLIFVRRDGANPYTKLDKFGGVLLMAIFGAGTYIPVPLKGICHGFVTRVCI